MSRTHRFAAAVTTLALTTTAVLVTSPAHGLVATTTAITVEEAGTDPAAPVAPAPAPAEQGQLLAVAGSDAGRIGGTALTLLLAGAFATLVARRWMTRRD